jgi:hypothetical protein
MNHLANKGFERNSYSSSTEPEEPEAAEITLENIDETPLIALEPIPSARKPEIKVTANTFQYPNFLRVAFAFSLSSFLVIKKITSDYFHYITDLL